MISNWVHMDIGPPLVLVPFYRRKIVIKKTPVKEELHSASQVQYVRGRYIDSSILTQYASQLLTQCVRIVEMFDDLETNNVVEAFFLIGKPYIQVAFSIVNGIAELLG